MWESQVLQAKNRTLSWAAVSHTPGTVYWGREHSRNLASTPMSRTLSNLSLLPANAGGAWLFGSNIIKMPKIEHGADSS